MPGPMNSGPVMAPPQPQNPQGNGHGGPHHVGPTNSPNDPTGLGMQQSQQTGQLTSSNGVQPDASGYYGSPTTSQMPNVADAKFNAALNSGGTQQPISPHMQQNGFVSGGQGNYGQQVQGQNAQNANQSNATGGGGVPGNGANPAGTWTGSSTLTYTQAMQPPDPRTLLPGGYCK